MLLVAVGAIGVTGCAGYSAGATFQDGVELQPGPAHVLIRIEPPHAATTRRIMLGSGEVGGQIVLFASHRGTDRYLGGWDLSSTVTAWVDGTRCDGSLDLRSDLEYDGSLQIDGDECSLTLDRSHPLGAIDHALENDGPVAS